MHAPEAECITKGKARTPYMFGVKVSVAVSAKAGLVVGMRSMSGNPYDGHTVDNQLEQVGILTGSRLLIGHARRLQSAAKKLLKRRQVVEPMIGHMKSDELLALNWRKGAEGDALNARPCGAGHNLRMILTHLRVLLCARGAWLVLLASIVTTAPCSSHRQALA